MRRLGVATLVALGLAAVTAQPVLAASAVTPQPAPSGLEVELVAVATFPDSENGAPPRLNAMATLGERLFVVEERDGLIYELIAEQDPAQARRVELFFDVGAAIELATPRSLDRSNAFHGGLRSLAFHPDFAQNGRLYVSAMETRPTNPGDHRYLSDVADPVEADSVLLEFTVDAQSGSVNPFSYREVFRVGMPFYDHPIKQIAFDPFAAPGSSEWGVLYVAHGDGSVQSAVTGGGQNNDALGKVLRIDPLEAGAVPYSVPADNPFVAVDWMLDEVWSYGHRNPHNLSFARGRAGVSVLIAAEPGRDNVEEINLVRRGGDYGWPQREGTFVHLESGGVVTGVAPLPSNEATFGFTYPAAQYGHDAEVGSFFNGVSVAGGYTVANGSDLSGHYFFADFPRTGTLFHASLDDLEGATTELTADDPSNDDPGDLTQASIGVASILLDHDRDPVTPPLSRASLFDVFDDEPTHETARADVRFGQGPGGELYITSKRNNTVYLVTNSVAPDSPNPEPPTPIVPDPTVPEPIAVGPLREARSIAEVVHANDYLPSDARVLRLYQAVFDREPDLGGAKFWIEQVRGGASLASIAAFFGTSDEFGQTYGDVDDGGYLTIAYGNVFDRQPDAGGFEYWLERMRTDLDRVGVLLWFSDSPEFIEAHSYLPAAA